MINPDMTELHKRIKAAVTRSMEQGIGERQAFENHIRALIASAPNVANAYMVWLAQQNA
jgi:elongation factor P hydroxylase